MDAAPAPVKRALVVEERDDRSSGRHRAEKYAPIHRPAIPFAREVGNGMATFLEDPANLGPRLHDDHAGAKALLADFDYHGKQQ